VVNTEDCDSAIDIAPPKVLAQLDPPVVEHVLSDDASPRRWVRVA